MAKRTSQKRAQFQIYGKHVTVDTYGVPRKKLANAKIVYDLLFELPDLLGMKRLTAPYVAFDDWQMGRAKEDWGVSGFVMIYESHIACHTWPAMGYVSMDVYSCRPFNHGRVVNFLKTFWGGKTMRVRVIRRG